MFRRLTDFGHQRSWIEALGFYLAYLVLGIALSATLGFVAGLIDSRFGFDQGLTLGATVAIGICPVISFAILRAKGQLLQVGYLLVAALSVVGAVVGGLLLGLVFAAFLTTRPSARSSETVEAGFAL